jgi:hypothetical protein
MSLLDDLKAGAAAIDQALQPSSNEIPSLLASVVAFLEHGDKYLQAVEAGADEVHNLLAPPPPELEPAAAPAAPAASSGPVDSSEPATLSDDELEAQIRDAQAALDARHATANQTTVTHEPGAGEAPAS